MGYFDWIAPLSVPFKRRVQTFSAFLMLFMIPGSAAALLLLFKWKRTRLYMLLYLIWQFYFDDEPKKGTAPISDFFRNFWFWKRASEYFPVKLIKTAELRQERGPFMLACFPHGILPFSVMCNFATDGTEFRAKFPGLKFRVAVLNLLTQLPILAYMTKRGGAIRCDREALENVIRDGQSVIIVPGGAKESLLSSPGCIDLIVGERKGFIKVAVTEGAHLVPVLSFGEADLFNQLRLKEGGIGKRIQSLFTALTSFAPPLIMGRGFFNYSFGLLPHRREIRTVIGEPIYVQKTARSEPDFESLVDYYHQEFMLQLEQLYATHRNSGSWEMTLESKQRLENMEQNPKVAEAMHEIMDRASKL